MKIKVLFFVAFLVFSNCKIFGQKEEYQNPILAGFYPDPSICRVDSNYYLVNSTFAYFPGVPIFQSTDLVHWKQIGNILDRPSQLNLSGREVWHGIFAPTIRYNNGIYYMITTFVYGGGNFVVTAKNPAGPWSEPVFLPDVQGIDPSLFFDNDGKAYIIHNGEAPDNKPLYDGHRAIWLLDFDPVALKTIGPRKLLINGGTDISQNPVWIEGPHIFKKDEYYYLIAAEGGTGFNHSEVVFRSENVYGPYENYSANPILTQKNLDNSRPFPVTNTGHADFVLTQNNEWWAVFLGCRPYQENIYNTGRETFMAPVTWTADNWPVINVGFDVVRYSYPVPNLVKNKKEDFPKNGNFEITDNFDTDQIAKYWIFLRTPLKEWYKVSDGKLKIQLQPEVLSGDQNPAAFLRRQQHLSCIFETSMEFKPKTSGELAGLTAFMNEKHFYVLAKTLIDGKPAIALYKSNSEDKTGMELISSSVLNDNLATIYLKVEINGAVCSFMYSTKSNEWLVLKDKIDATYLSTEKAGGFTGVMLGAYATSQGIPSSNEASYDWIRYTGSDQIYFK